MTAGEKILTKIKYLECCGVVDDLAAFVGMKPVEICQHIASAGKRVKEEFRRVAPKTRVEHELFYRCCREYLFLNAYRSVWSKLEEFDLKNDQPLLDFAGGMGNDTVWLAKRGFDVDYYDISAIQREFVRFRVARRGLNNKGAGSVTVVDPYVNNRYDPLGCIARRPHSYGAVLFRDVLEHTPNYREIVRKVGSCVRPGGVVLEHTPFHGTKKKKNPMHLGEREPLKNVFNDAGFKSEGRGVWRRT